MTDELKNVCKKCGTELVEVEIKGDVAYQCPECVPQLESMNVPFKAIFRCKACDTIMTPEYGPPNGGTKEDPWTVKFHCFKCDLSKKFLANFNEVRINLATDKRKYK